MTHRLDWEKANRQEKTGGRRRPKGRRGKDARLRAKAMTAFTEKHNLACFKCGDRENVWAKTGVSARGPWAICIDCVRSSTSG
jgi:hypothetical protein